MIPARIPLIPVIFPHSINLEAATVPIARPPAAALIGEKCSDILKIRASIGSTPLLMLEERIVTLPSKVLLLKLKIYIVYCYRMTNISFSHPKVCDHKVKIVSL
jgi:hypothetical protein